MDKIVFTLSPDEVKSALYTSKTLKPYKTKALVIAIVSVVLCAVTFRIDEPQTYPIPIALLVMNLFMWYGYRNNENHTIKGSTTNEETQLYLYDTYINVVVPGYDANWNILHDDVGAILEDEQLIIIMLVDNRLIAIPKRAVDSTNKAPLEKVLNYLSDCENKCIDKTGETD